MTLCIYRRGHLPINIDFLNRFPYNSRMALTANLKIVLLANDLPIAESNDSALWQRILAAINAPGATSATKGPSQPLHFEQPLGEDNVLLRFAQQLELPPEV